MSLKVVRLLLAFSVSVWLAGGCLFGCSNTAMASQSAVDEVTVVEGESCHTERSHDCCAKQKTQKPKTQKRTTTPVAHHQAPVRQTEGLTSPATLPTLPTLPTLASLPRGSMSDCPLVINATAATAKSNSNSPAPEYTSDAALPLTEYDGEIVRQHVVAPLVPNRGPTYLRCCVFLI